MAEPMVETMPSPTRASTVSSVAPPTKLRLQPIPPSADWRFDLAEGCPAHCQYCYLAGSLQGPPVTRAYASAKTQSGTLLVANLQYSGILFAAIYSVLLFGDPIDARTADYVNGRFG